MISQYQTTNQGRQTRSQLLQHIAPGEELTREQLMSRANLTYEQVRRQTKKLFPGNASEPHKGWKTGL